MKLKDLKNKHTKFHDDSKQFHKELFVIIMKWLKKEPRLTLINAMHFPLNLVLNLLIEAEKVKIDLEEFNDLPNIFIRTMKPFEKLKDDFLKIPMQNFVKKYGELYEAQFGDVSKKFKNMEWISVKDRLPEYYDEVLLYYVGDTIDEGEYLVGHREKDYKEGDIWVKYDDTPFHSPYCSIEGCLWMPLPEPPKN